MAEAANRSPFRLPRGVKKATLKPGKAGAGKQAKSMQFAPSDEHAEAEKDFDHYLQEAMTKKDAPSSQLSKEETESAAVMAKRLADRYAEEGEGITGRDLAMLAKAGAAVTAPADDDDDLAEPLDMQKLIQAREKMADLPPARPESAGPIDELPVKPELKPMPQETASAEETLQPLPEDEKPQKKKLSPMPSEEELLEALKGFPKGEDNEGDAFAKKLAELALKDNLQTEEFGDDEPGGPGGGPRLSFAADPRLPGTEPEPKFRGLAEKLTPVGIWLSFATMVGAVGYAASRGGVDLLTASLFGAGILIFVTVLTLGAMMQAYSPILLTSFLFKRPGRKKDEALALAGGDLLGALGLAEGIIDADADARLVTTRDGVVVYANDAYLQIAEEAGIVGATGLPPRIDRLFGQSGTESSKMFRLAKACRSGLAAEEVLTQTMGRSLHEAQGDLPVRRFTVQTRPMRPTEDGHIYATWRLQEQEVDRKQDSLKAAFFAYPRPVIAVERSGSIAWINTAAAELFGTKPGQPLSLGDLVLGESNPVVRHLWEPEAEDYEARIRQRGSAANQSKDVVLTPFTRGGPGEGFICVEVADKAAAKADPEGVTAGADLTDAPFGVAVLEGDPSADGKVTYSNELFRSFFPQADEGAKFTSVLASEAVSELMAALKSRPNTKPLTKPIEVRVGEGAQAHTFRLFARPVRRRRGAYGPRQTVLYAVDITYQRRMEEETIQGQKLQQIGQIAGSVAHDFNNLLLVVKGSTELLMRNHPVGDPSYRDLAMIYETSQRAQDLTRNLLAFSRKQTLTPEICSITELLNDFTPALKRCVSEKVQLNVVHGRNLPEVKCDKGQVDLAIMNLAVNARDAMTASKGSGTLTIETRQVPADQISDFGYEVLEEVDHVLIEVADTGGGVPEEHVEKIFEPFFTTKGEGQGTGLGLSTVAGAIGQMGGRIFLFNRKGDGATFRIFLPAVTAEEAAIAKERRQNVKQSEEAKDVTGKGRILVVEDEDGVRSIVVRALGMCGYEIHEATDGEEALEMIEEDEDSFDLVLTDIMMPEMDGPTLIQEAGDKLKGAKVVFMSGYAEAAMREKLNEIDGAKYLQKPFTLNSVAAAVKEALAR